MSSTNRHVLGMVGCYQCRSLNVGRFTFMGANQDAVAVGQQYGFSGGACMTYAATEAAQASAWSSAAAQVSRARCGESEDFSTMERAACTRNEEAKAKADAKSCGGGMIGAKPVGFGFGAAPAFGTAAAPAAGAFGAPAPNAFGARAGAGGVGQPGAKVEAAAKTSTSKASSSAGGGLKADRAVPAADSYTVLGDWDAKLMSVRAWY